MAKQERAANWDLLRSLSMLLVVVVHSAPRLGAINGVDYTPAIEEFALICDPLFFALSGYFAIRPLKQSYASYLSHKVKTVVVPLLVYTTIVYFCCCLLGEATLGPTDFLSWANQTIGGAYWFVPALIPYLMLAPLLHLFFSTLSKRQTRLLITLMMTLSVLGFVGLVITVFVPDEAASSVVGIVEYLMPAPRLLGSYLPYFCLGYFARQIPSLYSERELRAINCLGLAAWACAVVLTMWGYQRFDPDYVWLPATIAIFNLFGRLRISGPRLGRAITGAARHSYSIYLLQAGVIRVLFSAAASVGVIAPDAPHLPRVLAWLTCTAAAYVASLVMAIVVDGVVVKPLQKAYSYAEKSLCGGRG